MKKLWFVIAGTFLLISATDVVCKTDVYNGSLSKEDEPDPRFVKKSSGFRIGLLIERSENIVSIGRHRRALLEQALSSNLEQDYAANTGYHGGLTASSNSFSISFLLPIPNTSQSVSKHGKSDYLDIQLRYFIDAIAMEGRYARYKGYRLTTGRDPDNEDRHIIRRDIEATMTEFNSIYNFNSKHYSYRGNLDYSERQIKSAWGILAGASIKKIELSADKPILEERLVTDGNIEADDRITGVDIVDAAALVGAGGTLVVPETDFLFHASLLIGPAYQMQAVSTETDKNRRQNNIGKARKYQTGATYFLEPYELGLQYSSSILFMNTKDASIAFDASTFRGHISTRF